MIEYYNKRAREYELIYHKSERQNDLRKLEAFVEEAFKNSIVLEIACGTGYWTNFIAKVANSIIGIDASEEVIEIAKEKTYEINNIQFFVRNFNNFYPNQNFNALFGGFIWSHIPIEELPSFVLKCFSFVDQDSNLIFIDNKFVSGSSTEISRFDSQGNSFQVRYLKSGEKFEIMKNFMTENDVNRILQDLNINLEWNEFEYYWIMKLSRKT